MERLRVIMVGLTYVTLLTVHQWWLQEPQQLRLLQQPFVRGRRRSAPAGLGLQCADRALRHHAPIEIWQHLHLQLQRGSYLPASPRTARQTASSGRSTTAASRRPPPSSMHTTRPTSAQSFTTSTAVQQPGRRRVTVKFTTPTVANGNVYVGGRNAVTVYGMLTPSAPLAATPTFSPAGGTYSSTQSVTIKDSTPSASIYYTTNGNTPSTGSTLYSAPVSVSASETIEAIAIAAGSRRVPWDRRRTPSTLVPLRRTRLSGRERMLAGEWLYCRFSCNGAIGGNSDRHHRKIEEVWVDGVKKFSTPFQQSLAQYLTQPRLRRAPLLFYAVNTAGRSGRRRSTRR